MNDWEWTPNVAVGPIRLAGPTPVESGLAGFRLTELKRSGGELWTYYWHEIDEISVIALDGKVASVACHKYFCYGGRNLIGLTDGEIRMQFRDHTITTADFPFGYTLEVDALGLELDFIDDRVSIASAIGPN